MSNYCGVWGANAANLSNWTASDWEGDDGHVLVADENEENAEATLEREFERLAKIWRLGVASVSSTTKRVAHPAYLDIIALGKGAIPLLLAELQREPNHWFQALRTLTKADPVQPSQRGKMQEMANAWIEWGRDNGYVR